MKKYLLLIPTLFVMLLNVIGCGQVVFAAESGLNYSQYFQNDISDLNELFGFDFTDYDAILSTFNLTSSYPYYFYTISAKSTDYEAYINGTRSVESLYQLDLFFFEEEHLQNAVENNYYLRLNSSSYRYCYLTAKQSSQYYPFGGLNGSVGNLFYYKNTGTAVRSPDSSYKNEDYCNERIYFYQSTNIPDFPFPDFVNHGNSSNKLKVDVHFKPNLSGEVERMTTSEDGTKSFASQFRFTLTNNSNFPIQYQLYILSKSSDLLSPGADDYVFRYYSDAWVYSHSLNGALDIAKPSPLYQNKSTYAHYVPSGESIAVFFNYSQINLKENVEYTVCVTATRCDFGHASEFVIGTYGGHDADARAVEPYEVVYSSDFSMAHYSDVKYNPTDSSNGVKPWSSSEDSKRYKLSYNASEGFAGTVDLNSVDVYSDPDSWFNKGYTHGYLTGDYVYDEVFDEVFSPSSPSFDSFTSSSSNFNNLAFGFSNFFSFVGTAFSYFPPIFQSVFLLGLTSLVVFAVIKAVLH